MEVLFSFSHKDTVPVDRKKKSDMAVKFTSRKRYTVCFKTFTVLCDIILAD